MIKKFLRNIVYHNDILFSLYFSILFNPKDYLSKYLNNLSRKLNKQLFFIQIGANDGNWGDPIYKFIRRDRWKGILIEPQKIIFNRLKKNYKKLNNLFFENVAIDTEEGERILYKISFCNSQWASGISSFIKNDIQKLIDAGYITRMAKEESINLPENKEEWIGEETVKIQTLKNILKKHQVKKIDLIMIDTEGYDFEIIKTIPFDQIKPTVIIYEHTHFDEKTKNECLSFLKNLDYETKVTDSDVIAEVIQFNSAL